MKKIPLFILMGISLFFLAGASVWEGAAVLSEELPENGLYIATNSLPLNTVVDVTNLENGMSSRVVVASGLSSSGFLALLSRDTANALGISKGSLSRIRMSQNPDPLAFSRFFMDTGMRAEEDFMLVPDRLRPPEGGPVPDPSQFISGYTQLPQASAPPPVDSSRVVEPVRVVPGPSTASPFSAPMITAMERGMYYVQVAAYTNQEAVEYEITRRIDRSLPIAIMETGSAERPVYRVLIGPVNFADSAAIMDRYKSVYQDAFVWQGR